jgi:predicted ATPase
MIRAITVKNFKSIVDERVELGRFNVFIGANGSGKTNLLEATGMMAAAEAGRLTVEDLLLRGLRVARPAMTLNAFSSQADPLQRVVTFGFETDFEGTTIRQELHVQSPQQDAITTGWTPGMRSISGAQQRVQALVQSRTERIQALSADQSEEGRQRLAEAMVQYQSDPFGVGTFLMSFGVYAAETPALRGMDTSSHRDPVGLHGENLDVFLARMAHDEPDAYQLVIEKAHGISWLSDVFVDEPDALKFQGHKLGRSTSRLYFRDRYIPDPANVLAAENANEGVLHLLFYLALFASKATPAVFAIDNIETGLNPSLCTRLIEDLVALAKTRGKQVLVVTQSPAVLDGMNLHDDDERLFEVFRDDEGHTKTKRIKLKPNVNVDGQRLKLSELWMRGALGAIPTDF